MFGEVTLRDPSGFAARALGAVAELPTGMAWALVGGLAVMCRLQRAHRVTADADMVVADRARAEAVFAGRGATHTPNGVAFAGVISVDLIDVSEGDPDDPRYLAHCLALLEAPQVSIVLLDTAGAVEMAITVPVATAEALVAMKLTAAPGRSASRETKRASDLYDVHRLLALYGPDELAKALAGREIVLVRALSELAGRYLVDDAAPTARRIRTWASSPEMEALDADDLLAIGQRFVRALGVAGS